MRIRIVVFIFLVFTALSGNLSAQEVDVTVKGEVVDIVSYMTTGAKPDSPGGLEVALANAEGGNPLGILEEGTGILYVATMKQANTGANQTLSPWLGLKVAAKGKVHKKGEARVLVLTTIGKRAN